MKTQEITTTDLADFGARELKMLIALLTAWQNLGLPDGFDLEGVVPMMNRNSGHVFLTNSEYQVAMLEGNQLALWHTCSNCGNEGFLFDMGDIDESGKYTCQSCGEEF